MQTYDCKIRLGGAVTNEVRKAGVTAAEIMVLQEIHGADAVSDIVAGKMDKRSHAEERRRLYDTYANPETNNPETVAVKVGLIRGLFGHDALDLPIKLPASYDVAEKATIKRGKAKETETAGETPDLLG